MTQFAKIPPDDLTAMQGFYAAWPRHPSYPSIDHFIEAFGPDDHASWLGKRGLGGFGRALELYVHVPVCGAACHACGRNKDFADARQTTRAYLEYLDKEMRLQSSRLSGGTVLQSHWGGDTASLVRSRAFASACSLLDRHFRHAEERRCVIEIDPLGAKEDWVEELLEAGAHQLCLTLHECEAGLGRCVELEHLLTDTQSLIHSARKHGVASVTIKIVFGGPRQTVMSLNEILKRLLALSPQRVSLQNYAPPASSQAVKRRTIGATPIEHENRLQLFGIAMNNLSEAGYVQIGLDQFAKPEDELTVAQNQGRLHRNFQNYSAHGETDLLGIGVGSISAVGPTYSQNARSIEEYFDLLHNDVLPVGRGIELSADDLARRTVINALICHAGVSFQSVEIAHLLDFRSYFAEELEALKSFVDAGCVTIDDDWLSITQRGRYIAWAICQVFDRYARRGRATVDRLL